jgi:hypothetical protein
VDAQCAVEAGKLRLLDGDVGAPQVVAGYEGLTLHLRRGGDHVTVETEHLSEVLAAAGDPRERYVARPVRVTRDCCDRVEAPIDRVVDVAVEVGAEEVVDEKPGDAQEQSHHHGEREREPQPQREPAHAPPSSRSR